MIGAGVNVTPERDIAAKYAAGFRKGMPAEEIAEKMARSPGNLLEMDIPFDESRVFEQDPAMRTPDMDARFNRMVQREFGEEFGGVGRSAMMKFQSKMMRKYGREDYFEPYVRAMNEAGFDFVRDTGQGFEEISVLDRDMIRPVAEVAEDGLMASRLSSAKRLAAPAIGAAKRALTSPTAKRLAAGAVGLGIPKVAGAAMSGAAGMAADLVGGPAAFLKHGYSTTQDPYQQLKFTSEQMGRPLAKLSPAGFDKLNYDAVVRAKQEGYLTPEAEEQYVNHLRDIEGIDVRAAYGLPRTRRFGK